MIKKPPVESVAIILSVGIVVALLLLVATAVYAIAYKDVEAARVVAISQILSSWGSTILGILGAYIGYSFGKNEGPRL